MASSSAPSSDAEFTSRMVDCRSAGFLRRSAPRAVREPTCGGEEDSGGGAVRAEEVGRPLGMARGEVAGMAIDRFALGCDP